MISIDGSSFSGLEEKLTTFLKERFPGLNLDVRSTVDDRDNLHYQQQRKSNSYWIAFTNELIYFLATAKMELFVG